MYQIAAIIGRPGPPAVEARRGWHLLATTQPVGVQHAVPRIAGVPTAAVALCGADISGWVIFTAFAPGCTASCQRCGQLVASAESRTIT